MVATLGLAGFLWFKPFKKKSPPSVLNGETKVISSKKTLLFLFLVSLPLLHVLLIPPYLRDDMIYHLLVPKLIALSGGFVTDPFNINTNFPMLFEMPLVLFELINNVISPFIINLVMLFLLSLVCGLFLQKHTLLDKKWILLSMICIMYTPVLYDQVHSCYVEIFFTLLIVMGFYEYLIYRKDSLAKKSLLKAFLFIGLSCAVKYHGLVYLLFISVVEFVFSKDRKLFYKAVGVAVLVCLPWYIKNWITLGNPVYPMLHQLFPSEYLSFSRAKNFNTLANNYHFGKTAIDYLLIPIRLITGFPTDIKNSMFGFGGALSLFYGLSFFVRIRKGPLNVIGILFLFYGLLWVLTSQQSRFLLPAILLASLAGLDRVSSIFNKKPFLVWFFFLLVFIQSLFFIGTSMKKEKILALIAGKINKTEFLHQQMPYSMDVSAYCDSGLNPDSAKVMTIGLFGRAYYFNIAVLTNTYYDEEWFDRAFWKEHENMDYLISRLKNNKITYLLINNTFFNSRERLSLPLNFELQSKFFSDYTVIMYQNGPIVLYRLRMENM
jgi:hypothetical protein